MKSDFVVLWEAHRGGGGRELPESTPAGFEYAWRLGGVPEADVNVTSDGVMMSLHDGTLDRTARVLKEEWRGKPLSGLLSSEVRSVDIGNDMWPGQHVPAIEELLARIRAALRSAGGRQESQSHQFTAGPVTLDPDSRKVTVNGTPVELTRREFDLLACLLEHKGKVLSRSAILNTVWGYDYVGETNTVDVYIRFLRSKLDEVFGIHLIETVRGVGYVIRGD